MPSLRKACHACTRAKRKCSPQLPRCQRCIDKDIECVYDLEPVTTIPFDAQRKNRMVVRQPQSQLIRSPALSETPNYIPPMYCNSIPFARETVFQMVKEGRALNGELPRVVDNGCREWLEGYFCDMLERTRQGVSSATLHESTLKALYPQPYIEFGRDLTYCDQNDIDRMSMAELVLCINEVVAYFVHHCVGSTRILPLDQMKPAIARVAQITARLLLVVPTELSAGLSPWQAWIMAESTRRTIIFATFVQTLFAGLMRGWIVYEPYVETLPFDSRSGLWEARTEAEWNALISYYGGVHTSLQSWNEFIESNGGPKPNPVRDGLFQRILMVSFHGAKGVECVRQAGPPACPPVTMSKRRELCWQ